MQNLRENSLEMKRNLNSIRKRKNKLTSGHGRMIIQLRAAIFERIRHVQIQALQTVFICLLSLPVLCVVHLWFKRNWRHVVYNNITHDSVMCSLTLRHVTENRCVKCPVHFFGWNIFHLLSYGQNLLTNRIAGKLMNIKKIKLLSNNLKFNSENLNSNGNVFNYMTVIYSKAVPHGGRLTMLVENKIKLTENQERNVYTCLL